MKRGYWLGVVASLVILASDLPIQAQQKEPPKEYTNSIGMKFVWCADLYLETRRRAEQLLAAISEGGKYCVLRGGSYSVLAWTVRSAYRNYNEPSDRNHNYGVRVALTFAAQ